MMRHKLLFSGAVALVSLLFTLASYAQPTALPGEGMFLPFHADEAWYVCRGYQIASHEGNFAFDLTIDPAGFGDEGCYGYSNSPSSAGHEILAPGAGRVFHVEPDLIELKLFSGGCLIMGHMVPWTRPEHDSDIEAHAVLGTVAAANGDNGNYAHIHIEARADNDCLKTTSVPFEGPFHFFGVPDLPDRTLPESEEPLRGQYHRTALISRVIQDGEDDAGSHHRFCNDAVDQGEIYLGTCDETGTPMVSGLRFEDLPLAQGDYISAARLVVQTDGPGSSAFQVDVGVEGSTHALPFALGNMPAVRLLQRSRVLWALGAGEDPWDWQETRESPELRTLLHPLVQRLDWLEDNNAVAMILRSRANPLGSRRFMAEERGGDAAFGPARLVVTRFAENPPIANAGPDQVLKRLPTVAVLDGRKSSDPDGDGLTYSWIQTAGPYVEMLGTSTATPRVYIPGYIWGDLEFELAVTDDSGETLRSKDRVVLICNTCGPL